MWSGSVVAVFVCALASVAVAQTVRPDTIEGVYRVSAPNGDSPGAKYRTTDELRILKHGADSIYFDVEMNFFNGHTCSISGFARAEKGGYTHRGTKDTGGEGCEFRIRVGAGAISFEDVENKCRATCGARGGYNGQSFRLQSRKPFPNAAKFRRSDEYREGAAAFATGAE